MLIGLMSYNPINWLYVLIHTQYNLAHLLNELNKSLLLGYFI